MFNNKKNIFFFILCLIGLSALSQNVAHADETPKIPIDGFIQAADGSDINGTVEFTASVCSYDSTTNSMEMLWSMKGDGGPDCAYDAPLLGIDVEVTNGHFSLLLGDTDTGQAPIPVEAYRASDLRVCLFAKIDGGEPQIIVDPDNCINIQRNLMSYTSLMLGNYAWNEYMLKTDASRLLDNIDISQLPNFPDDRTLRLGGSPTINSAEPYYGLQVYASTNSDNNPGVRYNSTLDRWEVKSLSGSYSPIQTEESSTFDLGSATGLLDASKITGTLSSVTTATATTSITTPIVNVDSVIKLKETKPTSPLNTVSVQAAFDLGGSNYTLTLPSITDTIASQTYSRNANNLNTGTISASLLPATVVQTNALNVLTSPLQFNTSTIYRETGGGNEKVTISAPSDVTTSYNMIWPDAAGSNDQVLTWSTNGLSWSSKNSLSGGADTALDNLSAVAINTSLLPGVTNSIDLGSAAKTWRSVYFGTSARFVGSNTMTLRSDATSDYTVYLPTTGGRIALLTDVSANTNADTVDGLDSTAFLKVANNLSDVNNAVTARTNLGVAIGTDVLAPNGNGSGLTNLTAANLTGTVADARLSSNIAKLNTAGTFIATQQFNTAPKYLVTGGGTAKITVQAPASTPGDANIVVTLPATTGMVALLSDVSANTNADTVDGLDSTAFLRVSNNLSDVNNAAIARTNLNALAVNGDGSSLTNLNASQLMSGVIPDARFPVTLPAISGTNLTNLNASQLTSGVIPDARFPVTLPAISGANLTNLNASQLTSGIIPDARFPATLPAVNGSNLTNLNAASITSGLLNDARLSTNVARLNADATVTGIWTWANDMRFRETGGGTDTTTLQAASTLAGNQFIKLPTGSGTVALTSDIVGTYLQIANNLSDVSNTALARTNLNALAINGDGSSLTNLNAASISSGILNDARLSNNVVRFGSSGTMTGILTFQNDMNFTDGGSFHTTLKVNPPLSSNLMVTLPANSGTLLTSNGNGSQLTNLSAGSLTGVLPTISGSNLTNLNAAQLTSGVIPDARFPATLPPISGTNLTNLNAASVTNGILNDARLSVNIPRVNNAASITSNNWTFTDGFKLATGGSPNVITVLSPALGSSINVSFPNSTGSLLLDSGNGSKLTNLSAANLVGTLPSLNGASLTSLTAANLTGPLPVISGASLTNLTAANLTGTLPAINGANLTGLKADNLTGTLPTISGANLTNLNASNITSGVLSRPITSSDITGGTINNTPIGMTTASIATFTDVTVTGSQVFKSQSINVNSIALPVDLTNYFVLVHNLGLISGVSMKIKTTTPNLVADQLSLVCNDDAADNVIVLNTTGVNLIGGVDKTLSPQDCMRLYFDGTNWVQVKVVN